jgi:hypothetical protein
MDGVIEPVAREAPVVQHGPRDAGHRPQRGGLSLSLGAISRVATVGDPHHGIPRDVVGVEVADPMDGVAVSVGKPLYGDDAFRRAAHDGARIVRHRID